MSSDMLQEAYRLIRAGSKKEAARMLVPYVRASPNDADAWWLLANAFEEPDKQLRALDRVLHLRPDDIRAQKLYDKLAPPAPDLLDTPSVPIPVPPVAADVVPEPEPEATAPAADAVIVVEEDVWDISDVIDEPEASAEASAEALADDIIPPDDPDELDDLFTADDDDFALSDDDFALSDDDFALADEDYPPDNLDDLEMPDVDDLFTDAQAPAAATVETVETVTVQPLDDDFDESDALPFDEPLDEAALYADEPVIAVPTVEAPPAFEQAASASSARTRTRMRSQGRPRPRPRQRRSGSSRNFLAVFLAFLVLASCAVGVLVTVVSLGGSVGESVGTALAPVGTALAPLVGTGLPDIAATLNPGGAAEPDGAPLADVVMRGRVAVGQTVSGIVDSFRDNGWTFAGSAGQALVIELNALDAALDPQLHLHDVGGALIAENDDISADNHNARIDITLPADGTYVIRVSAFAAGGAYELTVSEG